MYSFKNARFHDEIKKWNTAQLIEALEINGLGDCCHAVQNREIDGESFLNLTEGQLSFWKNQLSMVQIRRLWSYIQLAQEKPQDFIANIPQTKSTGASNKPKVEKIKSPIANLLEKQFGQQINPTPATPEVPETNYPKVKPLLNPSNDFIQPAPPKPGTLPPKPTNLGGRRPPPPPGGNISENSFPVSSPVVEDRNFPPPVPSLPDITSRPPVPIPPSASAYPKPPSIPSPNAPYPKPPGTSYPKPSIAGPPSVSPFLSQYQEEHEEAMYEDEPMAQTLPPANPSSLYQTPPAPTPISGSLYQAPPAPTPVSNSIPIRRPAPTPNFAGRPLPTPPKDETIFPLPPNVVPIRNGRSPVPPEIPDLPRPPVFLPPAHIPDFSPDEEEQPEYDVVDELEPDYKSQPWFKDIDRKQATKILRGRANGTFIVRPSTKPNNECTFSVINDGRIYNLAVVNEKGKFVLGKNIFEAVDDIVERFLASPMVLIGPNNEDIYVTLQRY